MHHDVQKLLSIYSTWFPCIDTIFEAHRKGSVRRRSPRVGEKSLVFVLRFTRRTISSVYLQREDVVHVIFCLWSWPGNHRVCPDLSLAQRQQPHCARAQLEEADLLNANVKSRRGHRIREHDFRWPGDRKTRGFLRVACPKQCFDRPPGTPWRRGRHCQRAHASSWAMFNYSVICGISWVLLRQYLCELSGAICVSTAFNCSSSSQTSAASGNTLYDSGLDTTAWDFPGGSLFPQLLQLLPLDPTHFLIFT